MTLFKDNYEMHTFLSSVFNSAAQYYDKSPIFIEKDYLQSLFLADINSEFDYLMFKGGTSLSKCHKIINRFSEDIDISSTKNMTEGERRKLHHYILDTAEKYGMRCKNPDEVASKRKYNQYIFAYNSLIDSSEKSLIIECNNYIPVKDFHLKEVPNYTYDFLVAKDAPFHSTMGSFLMPVQDIERTYVDKIFALCDYHIKGEQINHSRHIYDLYKLTPHISFDQKFASLFESVRKDRQNISMCPSAMLEYNIPKLLKEVIQDEYYRKDYNINTLNLLGKADSDISFDKAIEAISSLANEHSELIGGNKIPIIFQGLDKSIAHIQNMDKKSKPQISKHHSNPLDDNDVK